MHFPGSFAVVVAACCITRVSATTSGYDDNDHHQSEEYEYATAPTATLDAGVIIGTTTTIPTIPTPVNQFLGVPFAAPPTRFRPPRDPEPWNDDALDTTQYKPACVQQFSYPEASRNFTIEIFNDPPPAESEDCLYLNVFAPAAKEPASKGKGRAVLFWIYGGGLRFGSASQPAYDGSFFAAYEDVIVVTTSYRTNVFGFPSSPELALQKRNLGFYDQRFALEWVQRNIHAFGGDPERVTLFGESAGAFSIDALLTSFNGNATPPFSAAILQSGQLSWRGTSGPGMRYPDSTPSWIALASALNCTNSHNSLDCVSQAPADTIKDIIERQALNFSPAYDDVTLVSNPATAHRSGNVAQVPVLLGTNSEEGRVFVVGQNNVTAYIEGALGSAAQPDRIAEITAAYPVGGSEFPTAYDAIAAISTDLGFQCGAALFANASSANPATPTWRYYFNASFPNTQAFPNAGVFHSSEIPIVFSTYPRDNATITEYALSNYMRGTWAGFAKQPRAGPDWNAVGTGDMFLGGAADEDVAVIGGEGWAGAKVVRQREVDRRCGLWSPLLERAP